MKEFFESLKGFIVEICRIARKNETRLFFSQALGRMPSGDLSEISEWKLGSLTLPCRPWQKYRMEVSGGQLSICPIGVEWKPDPLALSGRLVKLFWRESRIFNDLTEGLIKVLKQSEELSRIFLMDSAGDLLSEKHDECSIRRRALSGVLPIICAYFLEVGNFDFCAQIFERICNRVEREIEEFPQCRRVLLYPLVGVHISEGCCFQLEDNFRMRPLSQEELEDFFNTPGKFHPGSPLFTTVVEVERTAEAFRDVPPLPTSDRRVECLVTALRLLSGERIFVPFLTEKSLEVLEFLKQTPPLSLGQGLVPIPEELYILGEKDRAEVEALYRRVSEFLLDSKSGKNNLEIKLKKRVVLALGKYNESLDQLSYEWKLIANWIALEALFSPSDQMELSFRLALRTAIFLGQEKVYRDLRESYRIRSKILHGGSSAEVAELKELALATEKIVNQALRKILWEPKDYAPDQLEEKLLQNLTADCG